MSAEFSPELEKQAMRGDEMPDGLGYPEQFLYLSLRMLYRQLRGKMVSRPVAIAEKKKLMDEYRVMKFREDNGKRWLELIRLTELARSAYRKNPTIENADALASVLEGRKVHGLS